MKTLLITNKIVQSQTFICSRLHKSWLSEIKNDARKENHDFLKESDDFKIIKSQEEYKDFDFKRFAADHIFVVPELMWENDGVNEGYSVARELIAYTYKEKYIRLVFLSVMKKKELIKAADDRYKSFIQALPHVFLMDNNNPDLFTDYSEIHFKLIKYLAISDHGRLQKIEHEFSPIKSNITTDSPISENDKAVLLCQLEELSLFQSWASINISQLIETVKNPVSTLKALLRVIKTTDDVIAEVTYNLPGQETALAPKSNYNVLIIEDQKRYRELFYDVFSKHFINVFPDREDKIVGNSITTKLINRKFEPFSINASKEIIRNHAKQYQVIILDLLYKDEDENWLDFNGLDLYLLVKKYNPHAAIRIITSLPREIVAKIIETTIQEKISLSQVFTKKWGDIALKYSIEDRIEEINNECKEKARSKVVLSAFPKTGIFGWTGIPGLMHELLNSRIEEYKEHRTKTYKFYSEFCQGVLDYNSNGWKSGELPKPDMKSKITPSYFLGKLAGIMTHRMIVIHQALKDDDFKVSFSNYQEIIGNFTNISNIDKGYFQTKLGFNGTVINPADKEYSYFKLSMINLFPEEISFIADNLSEKETESRDTPLEDENVELHKFIVNILCNNKTYENWDELGLNFNPYLNAEAIDEGKEITAEDLKPISKNQLKNFLKSLLDNSSNEFVEDIALLVTNYGLERKKIKNKTIEILIDNLYQ